MSFRKRSIGLSQPRNLPDRSQSTSVAGSQLPKQDHNQLSRVPKARGVRSSPADGRPTTSTGTSSLDGLLSGHAGFPLGHSIVVEELGITDYAGALLRCYAAEGIVQGHVVHTIGVDPVWAKNLPQIAERDAEASGTKKASDTERMKIAWRYESLGNVSERDSAKLYTSRTLEHDPPSIHKSGEEQQHQFCHSFDLTKRLEMPPNARLVQHSVEMGASQPPFAKALRSITSQLTKSSRDTIHRLVIPGILSPISYPLHACDPQHFLQFLHALRSLLHKHPDQLTAMISLPLTIYPRSSGLIRLAEHLLDGVFELAPFPFRPDDYAQNRSSTSGAATANEEKPQGLVKVHKLPVFHERGGSGGGLKNLGDDLAFIVSRRRFAIRPFSLPPEDGDTEAQMKADGGEGNGMPAKAKMEF